MGVLFFNWYGYQLLSNYWQDRAERRLEASLDQNNYDESALISFKIPLTSLSYYNSTPGYERVNGQIDISGVRYQYVKRRIYGDTLEVLCLPNIDLYEAADGYERFLPPGQRSAAAKSGEKEFEPFRKR